LYVPAQRGAARTASRNVLHGLMGQLR